MDLCAECKVGILTWLETSPFMGQWHRKNVTSASNYNCMRVHNLTESPSFVKLCIMVNIILARLASFFSVVAIYRIYFILRVRGGGGGVVGFYYTCKTLSGAFCSELCFMSCPRGGGGETRAAVTHHLASGLCLAGRQKYLNRMQNVDLLHWTARNRHSQIWHLLSL